MDCLHEFGFTKPALFKQFLHSSHYGKRLFGYVKSRKNLHRFLISFLK